MSLSDQFGDFTCEVPKVKNELKMLAITRSGSQHAPLRVVFQAGDNLHECCVEKTGMLSSFTVFRKVALMLCQVEVNSKFDWIGRWAANSVFRKQVVEAMRKGGVK